MAVLTRGLSERFEEFLRGFEDRGGERKYQVLLAQMAASGRKSVVIDYEDLIHSDTDLAESLLKEPDRALKEFKSATFEVLSTESPAYAGEIKKSLSVRTRGVTDRVPLRKVDTSHLDKMIAFAGMVIRTSELRPLLADAAFVCPDGHTTRVLQEGPTIKKPVKCEGCDETRNLELDQKDSAFIDSQILRVQELPEELPPGQLPRFFDVDVEGDIVNTARPGDRAIMTGIVRAEQDFALGQPRSRSFRSKIDANYIEVVGKEPSQVHVSKEDEAIIKSIASGQDAYTKLIRSMAPGILGHDPIKEAMLLLLVGGPQTVLPDGTKLRGDINVFLVGDPGVAKSEMLKFAAQVAPRGMFASGRGSTAAGLSAAVIREKNTLMLEAGVVVLADQGIACIAEDTEVYDGERLVSIGKIWEASPGPVYVTKTGREARRLLFPVSIYAGRQRADLGGSAFALMRKRHSGDLVKVNFASGLSVKVTPDHLLRRHTEVKNLWVRADEVRAGDELKSPVKLFGPAATIGVTGEEAYAIGCIYGDGWLGPSAITISQSKVNVDVVDAIVRRLPSTFAVYDKGDRIRQLGKYMLVSRMYQLYSSEREFVRKVRLLLRNPSTDRILALSDDSLWSFLSGVFDTDGDLNRTGGKVVAVRLYPTKNQHELRVLLYALRRLGVYARIHGKHASIPIVQITGSDITRFTRGIAPYSVKLRRQPEEIVIKHKGKRSIERGRERVLSVERIPYDGYVYDFSVGKYHNYESSLVYVHNCIDEFDKMKAEDRSALHEQMEQQSYHPSTEVLLADGSKVRIGEFVNSVFTSASLKTEGKDCEIAVPELRREVYSVDLETSKVSRSAIDRVSRHVAPDHFLRVNFSNGRSVVVTPEHPMIVLRDAGMATVPVESLAVGDFVPAPRFIPNSSLPVTLTAQSSSKRAKEILQPSSLSLKLARILGYLVTEGNSYVGSSYEVSFTNLDQRLLDEISDEMLEVFGVSPTDRVLRNGDRAGLRYTSKTLHSWLLSNFPEIMRKARRKRAPARILGASVSHINQFLTSAFSGDGGVETDAVCYRTASPGLAEDYQDLLLKLGIASRIVRDRSNDSLKVYVTGESLERFLATVVDEQDPRAGAVGHLVERGRRHVRSHDVVPTAVVSRYREVLRELGMAYDGEFSRHLKEGRGVTRTTLLKRLASAERKRQAVMASLERRDASLREMRESLGWSQRQLSDETGVKRSVISYIEWGGYDASTRLKITEEVRAKLRSRFGSMTSIEELKALTAHRFLRVRSIARVPNEGDWRTEWVYDVTVEPQHNFVSAGAVLHNTVTIAKGGIYATLNARTAILAATNPILGKYNPYQNLIDNITLPIPLLTRFDLIFVLRDTPVPAQDERLATHILDVHRKRAYVESPPIQFELLKKYVAYAKNYSPVLTLEAENRIKEYYLQLRKSATEGQIGATPRTLESLIRLASAKARLMLRDQVTEDDALTAISLMNKMVEDVLTDTETKTKGDFGILLGQPAGERGKLATVMDTLRALEGPERKPIEAKVFKQELMRTNKFANEDEVDKLIQKITKEGIIFESKPGFFRRVQG